LGCSLSRAHPSVRLQRRILARNARATIPAAKARPTISTGISGGRRGFDRWRRLSRRAVTSLSPGQEPTYLAHGSCSMPLHEGDTGSSQRECPRLLLTALHSRHQLSETRSSRCPGNRLSYLRREA